MIEALFNKVATILKYKAEDSSWGSNESWEEWESFGCTIQPINASDITDGTKTFNEANAKIYIPVIPSLTVKDRVMVNNTIFDILDIQDGGGRGHHYKLIVKEVR